MDKVLILNDQGEPAQIGDKISRIRSDADGVDLVQPDPARMPTLGRVDQSEPTGGDR